MHQPRYLRRIAPSTRRAWLSSLPSLGGKDSNFFVTAPLVRIWRLTRQRIPGAGAVTFSNITK
jgi:hypothetical protein